MKSLLRCYQSLSGLLFVSVLLTSCAEPSGTPSVKALSRDRRASELVRKEKYEEGLDLYLKILETDPELAGTHSNIGVLLYKNKKGDEAVKSLEQALKMAQEQTDASSEFVVRYNLGVYYGSLKKIPEALMHYQAALEIDPTSKETKHNIELLIQTGQSQDQNQKQKNQDQQGGGQGQDQKDSKDQKDQKDKDQDGENKDNKEADKPQDKKEGPKASSPKYKPRPFQGDELSEGDVKKILGELKNQEQKIRANFEKKERKETKNDKDW